MKKTVLIYLLVCVLTGAFALAAYERLEVPLLGVEDANIYFVYARNLTTGHGFVYNVGGERVEGFTSLLWVLVCAVALAVFENFEIVLLLVSIALVSFSLTYAVTFVRDTFSSPERSRGDLIWTAAFLGLVYLMPQYVAWSTITLMEMGLWSSLLLVTTIVVLKADNKSVRHTNVVLSLLLVTMIASRPEAMLWGGVFIFALLLLRTSRMGIGGAVRSVAMPFAAYAVALIALTVFRVFYFGYPLPNTYYAKVSPLFWFNINDGAKYFSRYYDGSTVVKVAVLAVFLGIAADVVRLSRKRAALEPLMLLPLFGLVGIAAPILTGGDHILSFRFYQAVFPILVLNLLYFVRFVLARYIEIGWKTRSDRALRTVIVSVIAIAAVWAQAGHWRDFKEESGLDLEVKYAVNGRIRGQYMAEVFSGLAEYPSVAVSDAGGQKFTYPGEVVDLLGLSNTKMAHNGGLRKAVKNHAAFEKHTFYELMPDIVWARLGSESRWRYHPDYITSSFDNIVFKGLFFDREFQEAYVFTKIGPREADTDRVLLGFVRRDYLRRLDQSGTLRLETYEYNVRKRPGDA
jgi:hypothetical protein